MSIEPFELFQTNEQILVLQKIPEIELIQESRLLSAEYQEILFKNDCRKEDLKSMFHLVHKTLYMKKFD